MTQREDLEDLRRVLRAALEDADVAVKAQIAGQLRQVIKDLAALGEPVEEVSPADEIAARREARVAGAGGSARTPRRSQPRRSGGGNRAS